MMKRSERAIAGLISLGLVLGLSACGRAPEEAEEFVSRQAFEYHFYPEEYEEEYSSVGRTLPLEGETDRKSTRQNSSHIRRSRMPSSA